MDCSRCQEDPTCPLDLSGEWVGGSRRIGTLFWSLVSQAQAFAEVVLGKETLARLIFHHGECKVQERWDGAGACNSISLGIVSPIREEPQKWTCQRPFLCLERLTGRTLGGNKHLTSIPIIFPLAKGCFINKM